MHNLNYNEKTGKHSFFSVKQKAWHELGRLLPDYPISSEEAIIMAQADFEVTKQPLFTSEYDQDGNLQNENTQRINNFFSTMRTDTNQILGIVGSKYEVVQNRTAFSFFDSLVEKGSVKYETAGVLGNGERIFITAKMPDVLKVGRRDEIEKYIFLTTSHDGSGSIMAAFTPIRIVCNNTLNMALRNHTNAVYIKHTANAEQKLQEAARIIAITETTGEQLEYLFNKWANVRVNDAEIKKLISLAMAPNKEVFTEIVKGKKVQFSTQFENVLNDVYEYAMSSPTQQMPTTQNTIFGVYNAITGYYQNCKDYKTNDAKVNSIMFGTGYERTRKAFEICTSASDFLN
ncbi:DUF932 domain-containing protein [Ferruginibacter yonginensis]|uniref:DUF932 domain-containing protein n=1 Tax=Ferruginibacter yonginensis TaxID=1310416 RepID=A0ABV8QQE9_9BACT